MGVWDGTIHAEIQVRDVPRAEDARLIYWTTLELSANSVFLEANMKISLAKYPEEREGQRTIYRGSASGRRGLKAPCA